MKLNSKHWSPELLKMSYETLYMGTTMNPCCVKHYRNDNPFGTVDYVKGITQGIWEVVLVDTNEVESFNTLDDLIDSGWVVD